MSLYTKEEIDTYFPGGSTLDRATKFAQWRIEWKDRCIFVKHSQNDDMRGWLKLNNIRYTDRATYSSIRGINYYFRHSEDYLAAVLAII